MKNRSKGIAIGTLIAGAMGYIAGILTAPKSGRETRDSINHARSSGMAQAEKHLKRLHTELNQLLGEAEKSTKQGLSATLRRAKPDSGIESEIIGRAQSARQKARELLSALHDGNADDKDLDRAVTEATKAIKSIRSYLKK